jgi:hypothetical protein
MYQHQTPTAGGSEMFNWLEEGDAMYDKVLSRGVSSDDLLNSLNNNNQSNVDVKSEQDNPEEMKRKYDALINHQKELETRIQQLVHIIVSEEKPLPQPDLNCNYDDIASMTDVLNQNHPGKKVKPAPSPMDMSPHTPITQTQPLHQFRHAAEHASQQLIFSQERRQQLQQQQTESMLANFSPQLAVDPFWQMNFLNNNTPTAVGNFNYNNNNNNAVPEEPAPITRKRSNSEPGFGLLQFQNHHQINPNPSPFNFAQPATVHVPSKPSRKRSNSDAVVFVDEISKARDAHVEKESQTDQKRLVEQQGGYNRDKKKRKYDNMMSFFKFR